MNCLFFDIECCNGRNICEFGYVLTDENFNVLEKDDFTINPENKFNLTGRPDGRDIHLFYSEKEYYKSEKFPFFYERIKNLIEAPNQLIIGHSISNDAKFIRTACRRYELDPINFRFADSQRMFSEYSNVTRRISLESAGECLKVEPPKYMHKSDEDSLQTMNLVKNMCEGMECTLLELIDLCESCTGSSIDFDIKYDHSLIKKGTKKERKVGSNELRGSNYRMFLEYLDSIKPNGEIIKSILNNKSVCISINYERSHLNEMKKIVQLLKNHGAEYTFKASESDIFVKYDVYDEEGNLKPCIRLKHVNEAVENDKSIKIIAFDELLSIFGISVEDLSNVSSEEKSYSETGLKKPEPRKNNKNKKNSISSCLGDCFISSGINIEDFYDDKQND